ncbi:MAG: aromatic-ring-hydroxylating dioxygenase subunit beta [Pseudomonadota bacterium]
MPTELREEVEELIYREAYYLDQRDWNEWIGLFTEDVSYWMPAWISADELASDPETELALIYCESRQGLEDRVFRIETEDSAASNPLPRTCHVIGNVLILDSEEPIRVSAAWTVHHYQPVKGARVHGGRYEYGLIRVDGRLAIQQKKIIFLNDGVDVPLDIYNV